MVGLIVHIPLSYYIKGRYSVVIAFLSMVAFGGSILSLVVIPSRCATMVHENAMANYRAGTKFVVHIRQRPWQVLLPLSERKLVVIPATETINEQSIRSAIVVDAIDTEEYLKQLYAAKGAKS